MPNDFVNEGENLDAGLAELAEELSGETDTPEEPNVDEVPENSNEAGAEEGVDVDQPEGTPDEGSDEGESPATGEEPQGNVAGVPKNMEKDHHAFANMRAELGEYKSALEKMARAQDTDVDGLLEKLKKEEMEAEAAAQNIPFEVYERLRHLEEVNEMREREAQAMQFRHNIERFQDHHDLNQEEMRSFIDTCFDNGIDIAQTNIDLDILYKGLNYDSLIEAERQKWISKDETNRSSSSAPSTGRGKTPQSGTQKIDTVEDLDALFSQIKI